MSGSTSPSPHPCLYTCLPSLPLFTLLSFTLLLPGTLSINTFTSYLKVYMLILRPTYSQLPPSLSLSSYFYLSLSYHSLDRFMHLTPTKPAFILLLSSTPPCSNTALHIYLLPIFHCTFFFLPHTTPRLTSDSVTLPSTKPLPSA